MVKGRYCALYSKYGVILDTVSVLFLVWKQSFFLTTVQCQAHITVKTHVAMSIFATAPERFFFFLFKCLTQCVYC